MIYTHGLWTEMEPSRTMRTFAAADWRMLIIPSLQGDDSFHVIIDREGQNGLLVNRLMGRDEIKTAYGIQV